MKKGKHTLLHLGYAPHKIIETLRLGLGPEHREGEVMVLEVEAHTGEVDLGLDTRSPELLGVAYTRSLQDQR